MSTEAENPGTFPAHAPLWRLVKQEFQRDDVLLRAAALSYSTLASLVPVVAVVLAILSGPAFDSTREKVWCQISATLVPTDENGDNAGQQECKDNFEKFVHPLAQKMAAVSVFGFLVLLTTFILLCQSIESSFNAIWRVKTRQSIFLRLFIAVSFLVFGPVLLAVSVTIGGSLANWPFVGNYLAPSVFSALLFTTMYMVLPDVPVRFFCALTGGAVAGLLWEITKLLFLFYVTDVVSYNKLYGALGLIPMLFLWVYVSWAVILSGAILAYCLQNRRAPEK